MDREPQSKYIGQLDVVITARGKKGLVVDGDHEGSPVTRANTLGKGSNAKFLCRRLRLLGNSRVGLGFFAVATRKIVKGEEVFIDYGPRYRTPSVNEYSE